MVSCASCGCSKTPKQNDCGVTFHVFPKDDKRRAEWIRFVNKPEFVPKMRSALCSHHFSEDCFDRTSKLKVRLHPDAIPTIEVDRLKYVRMFNPVVTRPLKCEETLLREPVKLVSILKTSYLSESSVREQTPSPPADITFPQSEDTACEKKLKREIDILQKTNILKNQQIRHLQKVTWRQKKQINALKALTLELKRRNLMLEMQHSGENKNVVRRFMTKFRSRKLKKTYEHSVGALKVSLHTHDDKIFYDNFLNDHSYSLNCNLLSPNDQENEAD